MIDRVISRVFAAVGAVLLVAVIAGCTVDVSVSDESAASTDTNDFTFTSLAADYTLTRDEDGTSRMRVVETFTAEFPEIDQNRGMRRSIPDTYNDQPLRPSLVSVTDADGAARAAEVDEDDGVWSVTSRADDYVHGSQTYVFTYDLENVTWYFADIDADEFYWDVNGVDWAQPFGDVTATLHLDSALAAQLTGDTACFAGVQGSDATCPVEVETAADGSVSVTAGGVTLDAFETLTMAVDFAPGTFARFDDGYFASPWGWAQAAGFVALLGALAAAIVVRVTRLRDAPGRGVIAQYEPPTDVDALTGAVLLGRTTKAIPAEVLEQAVRGSIRIEEGEPRRFGGPRLRAVLVDAAKADGDGTQLLDGLFGEDASPGAEFSFGSTDTRLSAAAQKLLSWAGKDLARRGVYRPVRFGTRALPGLLAVLAGAAVVLTGVGALQASVAAALPLVLIIAGFVIVVAVWIVLSHRPLSADGVAVRDHLEGLKVFIAWAEADRIRMLQSPSGAERRTVDTTDAAQMLAIYEPLLPYAVVFGQEKQWAAQLAVYYESGAVPLWYAGAAGFDVAAFASGIGSLSASAMSSSSTSGGTGGGGGAGGGGGGGGGGGV